MADVIYLAIVLVFFGLCVGFVRACDRLIASSTEEGSDETASAPEFEQAAL